MNNLAALQLSARFSLAPNALGYCGRNSAQEKFKECIRLGECSGIKEEITKFIVLHPYLETLAAITKHDKYDYQVVEAFWLGNKFLEKAQPEHYGLLLENFRKQGVPDWLVKDLKEKNPRKFIPFHLFQVLHVGVGRASGAVPFNLKTINNCMIRWGRVKKIAQREKKMDISLNSLRKRGKGYYLYIEQTTVSFVPDLVQVAVGDVAAVHWGLVVKVLTAREEEQLAFWTKEVLQSFAPAG